jgi:MFS family permease
MAQAVQTSSGHRQNRGFILGSLTFGHGVAHLYDLGFPVFLTAIANTFALSTRQTGFLLGIRTSGTGLVSMGSGVLVDRFRDQWGIMLTVCMVLNVIAFCVIGLSPNWGILIIGVVLISIPGSLWHLPAIASLSRRFSDRRAFSISIHSFGSTVGNALGPLVAGTLLLYLIWREVLLLYAIPAGVVAIFVWWSLRDLGREEHQQPGDGEVRTLRTLAGAGLTFFRNPAMLALLVAASFRSIATAAMFDWTPFYLENSPEDGGLGYSYFWTGFQMALLTGTGAISSPILGQLSDKLGRKQILLPCLAVAAVLPLLVIPAGDGYLVPLVMAAIGLFSFALHQVMLAGILDGAARGTEATVAGAVFGINGAVGFASTLLVAYLIDNFGGYGSMYVYVTILTAVAGVIVLLTPFPNYKTQDS